MFVCFFLSFFLSICFSFLRKTFFYTFHCSFFLSFFLSFYLFFFFFSSLDIFVHFTVLSFFLYFFLFKYSYVLLTMKHQSLFYSPLNVKIVLFQTIQISMSTDFFVYAPFKRQKQFYIKQFILVSVVIFV